MSEFAIKVQYYYLNRLWDAKRIEKALKLNKITLDEYEIILQSETKVEKEG